MKIEDLETVASLTKPIAKHIELLSSRINNNRSTWSTNETATRLQLIDPMLRELGWDTADPDQVTPEYSVGSRNADYMLRSEIGPIAVVEAKNLGVKIDSDSRLQALSYVDADTIRYVVVTNGDRWELHSASLSETKPLGAFTISRDAPHMAALEAAKISREIMIATIDQAGGITPAVSRCGPGDESDPVSPNAKGQNWSNLGAIRYNTRGPKPIRIRFPDQTEIPIRTWNKVWISIAEWVVEREPTMTAGRFGNTKPTVIKTADEGFWGKGGFQLKNGLWIEPGVTGNTLLRTARSFLAHFNVDPSSVWIKFDNSP